MKQERRTAEFDRTTPTLKPHSDDRNSGFKLQPLTILGFSDQSKPPFHAVIALRSLSPDREPRKGGISKQLTVSGSTLSVRWSADEARILRVSVNSFLDHLLLVVETMEMFGPPSEARQMIRDSLNL
ncbi:hypothetical protein PAMA_007467 [Pampus argenteus]